MSVTNKTFALLGACGAVAALLIAGCASFPAAGAGTPAGQIAEAPKASLSLRVRLPRTVQVVRSEITGATISVTIDGEAPIQVPVALSSSDGNVRLPVPDRDLGEAEAFSLEDLPQGDAVVRLDLYRGTEIVGTGEALVPLIRGYRSAAFIQIYLDSRGKTDMKPLAPLPGATVRPENPPSDLYPPA
ncbi:hypothetical protein J7643_14330 [bacterium]|nr:hypothetical protein [bacterium]